MTKYESDQTLEETSEQCDQYTNKSYQQTQNIEESREGLEQTLDADLVNQINQETSENTYTQGYSFFSRFLWFHLWQMAKRLWNIEKLGRKIEIDDIPELEEHVKVESSVKKIKMRLNSMDIKKITYLQFIKIICQTFWKNILIIDIYAFFEVLSKMFSPYCIAKVIILVKDGDQSQAYLWIALLIITHYFSITFGQQSWTQTQRTSVQVRLGLINLLYDKISSLSTYSIKQANIGKIINMVSSDFGAIEWSVAYLFQCMITPLLFLICSYMLISSLNWIGIIAILLLISMIPLQQKIAKAAAIYSKTQTQKRDKKVKIFAEMIEGIRIIKMYGWEQAFNQAINKLREKEVKNTLYAYIIQYIEQTVSLNGTVFVALICLIICEYTQSVEVNTALIFYTIELINLMSSMIMKYIGQFMNFIQDFKILFSRLISILSIENVQMQCIDINYTKDELSQKLKDNTVLFMEKFTAYWHFEDLDNKTPVLKDINFDVIKGETISIIGQIGSGKSSFLYAVMKEIPRYKGLFFSTNKISYVEQEPYIFQGTVRDNILFGKPFRQNFYNEVIKACCLLDDLNILSKGDQTLIGEKGANLSGGQRARLCLARAVYADNDLYLLDDPLSAVDSKVAKQIFNNIINGLLKDKAVILVTHQLNYALRCQRIAVFDQGTIILQGNPNEMNFKDSVLASFIKEQQQDEEEQVQISNDQTDMNVKKISSETNTNNSTNEVEDQKTINQIQKSQNDNQTAETQLLKSQSVPLQNSLFTVCQNQKDQEFQVTFESFVKFLKASPQRWFLMVVFLAFGVQEALFTIFYKFLALYETGISLESFYSLAILIYTAFFIFKFIQNAILSHFILKTNQSITQKMITSISQAKPIIFDEMPSGIIINKFTTDINILDRQLPSEAYVTIEGIFHFSVIMITIIFTNYLVLIPIILEIWIFVKIFKRFKSLLMRTKQLDLENKAPIFQFFSSSLNGVLVINVYNQNKVFNQRMTTLMNNSIRTYDIFFFISRLFSILIQYVCLIGSGIGITLVLAFNDTDFGLFGQTVTFFIILLNFFHLTLRAIINLDTFMISSERAFSVIDLESEKININDEQFQLNQLKNEERQNRVQKQKINSVIVGDSQTTIQIEEMQESNSQIQLSETQQVWPNKGELIFDKVYMKYKEDLDHVLKGVCFHALPKERVAIVGRTGAGKSSIIQSLFRMSEIDTSSKEGLSRIIYDEKDVKDISLQQLRRNIGIIPQTPFVFSGSIYHNIDPLEEYSEQEIIQVLQKTSLYDVISKLPKGIHTDMSDSSSVFSMGQKQLVCLARVMLRNNKLIVLDEATANVDMNTDQKIQSLLKSMFSNTTIITIAHRLNTVADYDKIIVLDKGQVIEVGTPFELLALSENDSIITKKNTLFSQMVLHTGPKNADKIFQISKQTHFNKKNN
ncbi:ABC transporter family protein (macronuclear) [Tetrahymena thermophila SB210]|uniref:ABC transporter family protein n=1 Tax=Tetrahymena thermophila (strain SB210) TaxID=312017 RepID=I7M8W1_TETTS|nr:ABC transporter family protein [Tetrahymena thermophila SB210]EAR99878.2 ABC transporter family protein [Tetrahymena thermophila SB210]|eukprot:XP_001020123.2 ABC transporter family protein [Tetrahymena thermophila SB210]